MSSRTRLQWLMCHAKQVFRAQRALPWYRNAERNETSPLSQNCKTCGALSSHTPIFFSARMLSRSTPPMRPRATPLHVPGSRSRSVLSSPEFEYAEYGDPWYLRGSGAREAAAASNGLFTKAARTDGARHQRHCMCRSCKAARRIEAEHKVRAYDEYLFSLLDEDRDASISRPEFHSALHRAAMDVAGSSTAAFAAEPFARKCLTHAVFQPQGHRPPRV